MDIQVWSDVICPWCYLGKKRLETAIAEFPGDVTVTFRAYQLDPTAVPQPMPIKHALAAKLGGWERAEEMFAHVTSVAAGDGLRLDFDRAIAANTFDSHRLIAWAAGQDRQAAMLDALQRAHFADGVDLGSRSALAGVAASIGLDGAAALTYLESEAGTGAVQTDLAEARELGITSVPTFVIDGKYAVQGAQEAATLRTALEEVARREAVDIGQ
ncbi:DsbA family oxidoreductase [Paractinoplanes durhamensis]|uniref:DSBA oxidoreductase n=1 Tax=Paractinoplanes durhamensis TaxID=113563 RepID=A0ABQ3Z645_9ACTN|nr:DsbA family oxidoreductase [Actinoplanes durhamensis]GIE05300.1 DSBA oxidoreductase [Actinoplanes durhamensis]